MHGARSPVAWIFLQGGKQRGRRRICHVSELAGSKGHGGGKVVVVGRGDGDPFLSWLAGEAVLQ